MKTPYKRIICYDLETGGLKSSINPITEIAMVAIDNETLKMIDKFSIIIKPRLNLNYLDANNLKNAQNIFKNIAEKNTETGIKTLVFKGQKLTLKDLKVLADALEEFLKEPAIVQRKMLIENKDIIKLEEGRYRHIVEILFKNSYKPQALDVTKINRELLENEGVEFYGAFKEVDSFVKKHTISNSKPIIAGHNIGNLPRRIVKGKEVAPNGFDNSFMELFYNENDEDWFSNVNDFILDTLQLSRIKWEDLPSYSLGVCCHQAGITLKEAHRALPDTVSNAELLVELLKSLRDANSKKHIYKRKKFNFNY